MLVAHLLHLLAPGDEIAQMKQLHAQFVGPRMNAAGRHIDVEYGSGLGNAP